MRNRIDWDRLVPPGKNGHLQKRWLTGGLWAAGIWAVLAFTINYFEQIAFLELAHQRTEEGVFSPELMMRDFDQFLPVPMLGFLVVAVVALPQICINYASHRMGSRSDYLMRRLPDRWEWHRRCLTVPLAAVALSALLVLALLVIFFLVYQYRTPYQWLWCSREGMLEQACGPVYRLLYRIFC